MTRHSHPILTVIAIAALAFSLPFAMAGPFGDDGEPKAANKTAASGSDFQYLGTATSPLPPTSILSTMIKTSKTQDLVIQLSLECSLMTDVYSTTVENHTLGYTASGSAEAHVVVWIEIDGTQVPVSGAENGTVTFCDRVHTQEISDIDDSTGNFTIRQFQETMTANAFNWVALDLGSGVHTISVMATVEAKNTTGSLAEGAIAKRTLVVEPVRFASGATL